MTEGDVHIEELLSFMKAEGASDLHLRVPSSPVLRIDGALKPQVDLPEMTPDRMRQIFNHITTEEQREMFYRDLELDFAYSVPDVARFRVNVMLQRGTMSIAFRRVPFEIPTIDDLELPQVCKSLSLKPRGLILVTGPTGSGKSTTLASMIDYLNEREGRNIITIENPIEYLHHNKKSIIAQRDLGDDTHSFNTALVHALRHDPDVILVGEMRDLETIATAITAAETGHLVFATLHTNSASQTVDRIIDSFPARQQDQIRAQLAGNLLGIVSQRLIPRIEGGRVPAVEIMMVNSAIRNLIRENKNHQLDLVINTSADEGMISLNTSLADLVKAREISLENAEIYSTNVKDLKMMMQR